jgi:hypothetical protein
MSNLQQVLNLGRPVNLLWSSVPNVSQFLGLVGRIDNALFIRRYNTRFASYDRLHSTDVDADRDPWKRYTGMMALDCSHAHDRVYAICPVFGLETIETLVP